MNRRPTIAELVVIWERAPSVEAAADAIFSLGAALASVNPGQRSQTKRRNSELLECLAEIRGVTPLDIVGPDRGSLNVMRARNEYMWLLRQELNEDGNPQMSYQEIVKAVGRADHTTAISACTATEARIAARPALRAELLALGEARPALRSVG